MSWPARILACALCGLAARVAVGGTNFLVAPPGTTTPVFPYTTWEGAATDLVAVASLASVTGAGNTITVTNGTYWLTNEVAAAHVQITSVNGPEVTLLRRAGAAPHRLVSLATGGIRGFTIEGGDATQSAMPIGGGLYLEAAIARHCIVRGNVASNGGGVALATGSILYDSLVAGNSATDAGGGGGGCAFFLSPGWIFNCTIVSNDTGGAGGGVAAAPPDPGTPHQVVNSIVYDNQAVTAFTSNFFATYLGFTNCCTTPTNAIAAGSGNFETPPAFVDPGAGNFRLAGGSPCIDSGVSQIWMQTDTDLDGAPRILGTNVDVGAYEFLPAYPFLALDPVLTNITVTRGDSAPGSAVISNLDAGAGMDWSASSADAWIALTPPTSGLVDPAGCATQAWVNSSDGLAAGVYTGTVDVVASNGSPYYTPATGRVEVVLTVEEIEHPYAYLAVAPSSFSLSLLRGRDAVVETTVSNESTNSILHWTVSDVSAAWLQTDLMGGALDPLAGTPLVLTADSDGLPGGVYTGLVTLVATNENPIHYPATCVVECVMTVMDLQRAPAQLSVALMQGQAGVTNFRVWNAGAGVLDYTVASDQSWAVPGAPGGSLPAGQTNTVTLSFVNTGSLQPGLHTATITLEADVGGSATIDVALEVRAPPAIVLSPVLLSRSAMAGQNTGSQTVQVSNASPYYGIEYTVTTNAGWIQVSGAGTSLAPLESRAVTLAYAVSNLAAGVSAPSNYTGIVTFTVTNPATALGSPAKATVSMQICPKPRLTLNATKLSASVMQGRAAPSQGFDVWNGAGYFTLSYTLSKNAPWLLCSPTSGTSTGEHDRITVQYSTQNLKPGISNAVLTVVGLATDGVHWDNAVYPTQTVRVAMTIYSMPMLRTDAAPVTRLAVLKGHVPPDTVVKVSNGAASPRAPMRVTAVPTKSWIRVTPGSALVTNGTASLRVACDPSGMAPGVVNRGVVRLTAVDVATGEPALGAPLDLAFELTVREFKGFDFQGSGSGASDLVVYRASGGEWAMANLRTGYRTNAVFGGSAFAPAPGLYLGDGSAQLGVFHAGNGRWYARNVADDAVLALDLAVRPGAVPVPGDYDGDSRTDPCLYQESTGVWIGRLSGSGYRLASGALGGPGYSPLPSGDYDGDGRVDPGVYHRASGQWTVLFSASWTMAQGVLGGPGFLPVPSDYDGDGISDPAVFEQAGGRWVVLPSTTLTSRGYGLRIYPFAGLAMTPYLKPAPGDYTGDGKADLALYDTHAGRWYIRTTGGSLVTWGFPLGYPGFEPVWW